MSPDSLIELRAVGLTHGPDTGIKDVSLTVDVGEVLAVVGPSGAGKSTLLFVMAGLDAPHAGSVRLCGQDLPSLTDAERARLRLSNVGFVFQDSKLLPELTVVENVAWPLEFAGVGRREARSRAEAMLQRLGIGDLRRRRVSELSGGEQQRVALARALIGQPSVLMADEPTGNLDRATGREMLELLIEENRSRGLTIVLATHDAEVAEQADRIVELRDGRMVREHRRVAPDGHLRSKQSTAPKSGAPHLSWSMAWAYRHVRARAWQMALSVVAVALGVALVVAIEVMNRAVLDSFLETADGVAGRAALTVSAGPSLFFPEEVGGANCCGTGSRPRGAIGAGGDLSRRRVGRDADGARRRSGARRCGEALPQGG